MTSSNTLPESATPPSPPRQPNRSLAGRLIHGSSWRIVAQVMPLFVNLALTPFVITTLGRVGYGLWLVASTLTLFIAHVDGGIGRSSQYYFALLAGREDRVGLTRLLVTLSATAIGICGVVLVPAMVLAPDIAVFFNTPDNYRDDTIFLLRVLLVLVGLGLLRNLLASVLHAHEKFTLTSVATLLGYVIYAGGMVLVLTNGMGLRGIAYAFVAQQLVATLIIVPPALAYLTPRGIGFVPWATFTEVAKVSWRVQVSGLLAVASMQGVILIVGRLRPLQIPDFGPGTTFAQQLKLIPMNAVAPIQALMGRTVGAVGQLNARTEFTHVQRMWVRAVTGWVAVGSPAAYIGVNVWLPLDGNLAGQIAAIMLAAQFFSLLPQALLQWLLLVDRAQYEMWSSAVTVAVLLGLSMVLVPWMGAMGAAVGAVVGHLAGLVVLLVAARRLPVPVPSPLRVIPWWQAVLAGGLSLVLTWGVGHLVAIGRLPEGGFGLLACGLAAAPALALYVLITWGPGKVTSMVRSRLPKSS